MPDQAIPKTQPPAQRTKTSDPEQLRSFPAKAKEVFRRFGVDKCGVMAAALSFFTLLSIVPVILVAIWGLDVWMHLRGQNSTQATAMVTNLIMHMLPAGGAQKAFQDIAKQVDLQGVVHNLRHSGTTAGIIGVLGLVWAALQIFVNASTSLNAAFEVNETRSWVKLRLVCLGVLLGSGLLFLLSIIPVAAPDFVRHTLHATSLSGPVQVLAVVLAIVFNGLLFAFIYKFLPNYKTDWRDALTGGAVMGVAWVVVTKIFTLYLGKENKTYGALGGVIALISWMYYTNMVLLLGAEVTALTAKLRKPDHVPDETTQHAMELEAVYSQTAVPITSGPMGSAVILRQPGSGAKENARRSVELMRHNVQDAAGALKQAASNIVRSPEGRAGRAPVRWKFGSLPLPAEATPTAPPAASEKAQPSRPSVALVRSGSSEPNPPVEVSRQRTTERMAELKGNVAQIGRRVQKVSENIRPNSGE